MIMRSSEHNGEVVDYFENKFDLKLREQRLNEQCHKTYSQTSKAMTKQALANTFLSDQEHAVNAIMASSKKVDAPKKNFIKNNIRNTVLPQLANRYVGFDLTMKIEEHTPTKMNSKLKQSELPMLSKVIGAA